MAIDKKAYRHSRHAVHAIKFHFVWCPTRRAKVLKGALAARLRQIIDEVAAQKDSKVIQVAMLHVHLFVQTDVQHAPTQIVKAFKGRSSRFLRQEYTYLLRLPSLSARSYFVSTAGRISQETIERYIESQK
ncbi:MAG: IS200/IS605 family transposase [Rhodothermales bacterium]